MITRHLESSTRLAEHFDWPGLAQVCRLTRTSVRDGKTTTEVQYAVTSVSRQRGSPKRLLKWWRGHWQIENRLHWVRDVAYQEDRCRIQRGHGPQNLSCFRNAAISLLRLEGVANIAAALRENAYRNDRLMAKLGIVK